MSIAVQCQQCGREFQVREDLDGRQFRCSCGQSLTVAVPTGLMNLLDEELAMEDNPIHITNATEWAKASGNAELADELNRRRSKGLHQNQKFMMAVLGGLVALMIIVSLGAVMFVGK